MGNDFFNVLKWYEKVGDCVRYFKGYKFKTFIAVFFKFIEAVFELILPLLMVSLIDDGILKHDQNHVFKIVFYLFLLSVFGYLASMVCQYLASIISQRVGGKIRLSLFEKIQFFQMADYESFSSASLINRLTYDINQIQDMIARTIRLAVRAPMIIIGSVFAIYRLSPDLSFTLLMFVPVFVIVITGFMLISLLLHRKTQKFMDSMSQKVREFLSGSRIIFAFNKQSYENKKFKNINTDLSKAQSIYALASTLSGPFTSLMMNAVLILLVYMGAFKVNTGSMTQGQMLALINYCTQIVLTLIVFMNLVMIFSRGFNASIRVKEILGHEVLLKDEGELCLPSSFDLEFKDVSYSYKDEKRKVLKNLSFKVSSGQKVGIIGMTGSGKSSLLKLIMRFYDVSSGNILINNKPIQSYDLNHLRTHIAYVSQKAQFISASMEDVISNGDSSIDVLSLLEIAQGSDISIKGLDAKVEAGGKNFSGGQKQRLNIARALAKPFSMMIFDDSFSALDLLTDKNLRNALDESYGNSLRFIVSQKTSTIMDSDLILVLDKGRVIDQGSHQSLLKSCQLYQDIHQLQQGGVL